MGVDSESVSQPETNSLINQLHLKQKLSKDYDYIKPTSLYGGPERQAARHVAVDRTIMNETVDTSLLLSAK